MDLTKIIEQLRDERAEINNVILNLERLAARQGKRMGRPPAWLVALKQPTARRGRPPGSKNKPKELSDNK